MFESLNIVPNTIGRGRLVVGILDVDGDADTVGEVDTDGPADELGC